MLGGGAFVIGDRNAAVGGSVTFWGAQWSDTNGLSGGPAPSSFKGFEESSASPTCGGTWTARPGNSAHPPGSVPTTMAVVVTGSVRQSGSTIAGDVTHLESS